MSRDINPVRIREPTIEVKRLETPCSTIADYFLLTHLFQISIRICKERFSNLNTAIIEFVFLAVISLHISLGTIFTFYRYC